MAASVGYHQCVTQWGILWFGVASVIVAAGCSSSLEVFHCQLDSECELRGAQGFCDPVGLCTYDDPACATGRRYGDDSGEQSGRCTQVVDASVPQVDAPGVVGDADPSNISPECNYSLVQVASNGGVSTILGLEREVDRLLALTGSAGEGLRISDLVDVNGASIDLLDFDGEAGGLAVADGLFYVGRDNQLDLYNSLGASEGALPTGVVSVRSLTILNDHAYILRGGDLFGESTVFKYDLVNRVASALPLAKSADVTALGTDGSRIVYTTKDCSDCPVVLRKAHTNGAAVCEKEILSGGSRISKLTADDVALYVVDELKDEFVVFDLD